MAGIVFLKLHTIAVFMATFLFSGISSRMEFYGYYDDGYIDFTDMGSYNHGFQKNLNIGRNGMKPPGILEDTVKITTYTYESGVVDENFDSEAEITSISAGDVPDIRVAVKNVEIVERNTKYKEHDSQVDDTVSMKFLKRIVASLLRQMNVRSHTFGPGEAITIDLQAEISHWDFMTLNKFVGAEINPETFLPEVDSIISSMLHVVAAPVTPEFFETFKDRMLHLFGVFFTPKNLLMFSMLCVFLLLVTAVLWRTRSAPTISHAMTYGFVVIFLISCVWTFVSMLEDAKAENFARVLQTQNVPTDCEFDNLGWWDSAKYYVRVHLLKYEDQCVTYHREVMVDPLWRVSPTEAISQTLATVILGPAGYVGEKVGLFFQKASSVFPIWFQPFVLIVMFVVVFMGVFRLKIKTPFLSIEPGSFLEIGSGPKNNMLPDLPQQQIAEQGAGQLVEVKTRDACVDTSDFEEYLRSTSGSAGETGNPMPELLPPKKLSFKHFLNIKSSLVFVVLSGVLDILVLVLDKTLRQVPFVEDESNSPFQMNILE